MTEPIKLMTKGVAGFSYTSAGEPVCLIDVFVQAFSGGLFEFMAIFTSRPFIYAVGLTLITAIIAVLLNRSISNRVLVNRSRKSCLDQIVFTASF